MLFVLVFSNSFIGYSQLNNNQLPVLKQEERDSLRDLSDGYTILNSSTGCINYFFQSTWFELCGNCSPEAKEIHIDSIVCEDGISFIYFSPQVLGCNYKIINNQDQLLIEGKTSPLVTKQLKFNSSYRFKCITSSSCGEVKSKDWSSEFILHSKDYCKGEKEYLDPLTGIRYHLMSAGRACWMQENWIVSGDLLKNTKEVHVLNGENYLTWSYANGNKVVETNDPFVVNRGVCPSGYHLPNLNEMNNLIYAYQQNEKLSFFKQPSGGYNFKLKKMEGAGYYLFWIAASNKFILSNGSKPEVMESSENIGLPVRCVKD